MISESEKNILYCNKRILYVRIAYILFIILWTIIIIVFKLYKGVGNFVIIIPYILFIIAIISTPSLSKDTQTDIFATTFITIILVLSLPVLGWCTNTKDNKEDNKEIIDETEEERIKRLEEKERINKEKKKEHDNITSIILLAMVLALLSFLHVWVDDKWMCVWKHCRSSFETMSIVLFIYILICYFSNKDKK
jgi:hypothetical protein